MAVSPSALSAPPGYQTQAEDTGVETDVLCFHLLHQKSVAERLQLGTQLTRSARQLAISGFHQRFPHLSAQQFARKMAEVWLQEHCPPDYQPGGGEMSWIQDSIQLGAELHPILQAQGIPYYVTGGVAAIAYGESRTTQDLDLVLGVSRDAVPALAEALQQAGFYVPGVAEVAAGSLRTPQVTQIDTISRADLVVADDTPYERQKLARRQLYTLADDQPLYLISPEDLVISKLRWGQPSRSQKQWRDVLGILKTQQDSLDYEYMHRWAAAFDLPQLEQATLAAGVKSIADRQWAEAAYPTIIQAFTLAQERGLITQSSPHVERAEGRFYILERDGSTGAVTVISKLGDLDIACYDRQGSVLSASPTPQDREQWRRIGQRLNPDAG